MIRKFSILAGLLVLVCSAALAQQPREGEPLDRTVAQVADDVILHSDVMARLAYNRQVNPALDINDQKQYKSVLNDLINEKLVVAKAIRDSVEVTDEELDRAIDYQLEQLRRAYGSDARVQEVYNMTISEIKARFRETMRKTLLGQKMAQQQFYSLKVSQREVEDFYARFKDSLPLVPPSVDLYHIVKYVASEAARETEVRDLARKVRDSIAAGGDFAEFAARYSSDAGSANNGGDLGRVSRETFIPEFEQAAFELAIGEISQPVKTPFGYHVIEVLDKSENDVHVRHILFNLGQSDSDVQNTRRFLDSLGTEVRGGMSFEDLAREHSEEEETRAFDGYMERRWPIQQLSPDLQSLVLEMQEGEVTEALTYPKNPARPAFHIVYLKKFLPEHSMNLEDDYTLLEDLALRRKRADKMEEWFVKLRDEIFWKITL